MTEKSQRARKETASVAEASPLPAASSTESETPDLRTLLEQVLTKITTMDTKLLSMDTCLSNLENKSTTLEVLSSEESQAQGGRPSGAYLCRALEGPTVEEMEDDRLRLEQEEVFRLKNKNKPQSMPVPWWSSQWLLKRICSILWMLSQSMIINIFCKHSRWNCDSFRPSPNFVCRTSQRRAWVSMLISFF